MKELDKEQSEAVSTFRGLESMATCYRMHLAAIAPVDSGASLVERGVRGNIAEYIRGELVEVCTEIDDLSCKLSGKWDD